MNRERPTAVLVMAILNFVMGGLGLITFLCCGLGSLLATNLFLDFIGKAAPPPTKGGPDPSELTKMFDHVPGYYPVMGTHMVLCAGLCILLIAAGVGLLNMQTWARYSSVAASVFFIFLSFINLAYNIAVVQPGLERWQRDFAAKLGGTASPPAFGPSTTMNVVMAIFGFLLYIAYPVALCVVLFLPKVSAAFAAPLLPPEEPPGGGYGGLPPSGPSSPHVAPRRF